MTTHLSLLPQDEAPRPQPLFSSPADISRGPPGGGEGRERHLEERAVAVKTVSWDPKLVSYPSGGEVTASPSPDHPQALPRSRPHPQAPPRPRPHPQAVPRPRPQPQATVVSWYCSAKLSWSHTPVSPCLLQPFSGSVIERRQPSDQTQAPVSQLLTLN